MSYSNYTDKEIYKLTGTLPADRLEKLIDSGNLGDKLKSCKSAAEEASLCYMQEDFLTDQLSKLRGLVRNLRSKANQKALEKIIEDIEERILEQSRSSEYVIEELNKIANI